MIAIYGGGAHAFPITLTGITAANYSLATVDGTLTVTPDADLPTATTLVANPSSVQYGDPVTLTATVTPTGANPGAISGTVSFFEGTTHLG